MSEKGMMEEKMTILNKDEVITAVETPTDAGEANKTHEVACDAGVGGSTEVSGQVNQEKSSDLDSTAAPIAMDTVETPQTESLGAAQEVEIVVGTVEMTKEPEEPKVPEKPEEAKEAEEPTETVSNTDMKSPTEHPIVNESKESADHVEKTMVAIESDPKISSAFTETSSKSVNNDVHMDAQEDNAESKLVIEPEQQKTQTSKSIGSLGLLNQYASSSDEDEDSSSSDGQSADSESESDDSDNSSNNEVLGTPAIKDKELNTLANSILNSVMSRGNYREISSDSSDSDSDDSDVECIGSIPAQTIDITNDEEIQEFLDTCEENAPTGPIKAKGEFGIEDLPPIEELTITVPESECVELGKISGIVDTLVLVESLPGFAAVDIDTVLFLDKGNRTLGQVFDVMGNVASPMYCVRFNTAQDIQTKNIKAGVKVYVAPQTEYTNFIVLSDLMKQKGCDASWENDHEAPEGCFEFSDDEEERLARRAHNQKQRNRNRTSESSEQMPTKVTVKSEPNVNSNRGGGGGRRGRPKYQRGGQANKQPTRFYKDNRGYAITNSDSSNLYQSHPHQRQQMPPMHHNYSWHTAQMHATPSTSAQSMPYPYPPNHGPPPSNVYPNPFAMQTNQMNNYGPFNLQAFPPLPPPMSTMPPNHQPPPNAHFNRNKNSNSSFQRQ